MSEASPESTELFSTTPPPVVKEGEEIPDALPRPKNRSHRATGNPRGRPRKDGSTTSASGAQTPAVKKKEPEGEPLPEGVIDAISDVPYFIAGIFYRMKTGRDLIIPGMGAMKPLALGPDQVRKSYMESKEAFRKWLSKAEIRVPAWSIALGSYAMTVGGAVALDLTGLAAQAMAQMQAEQMRQAQGTPSQTWQEMSDAERAGATPTPNGHAAIPLVPDEEVRQVA